MDPLMRKLFQPREAREKLRGMGGIMSSSPRLAETVAKFQVGGNVGAQRLATPSAPDAPLPSAARARATRVGDRTFVLTDDGRVLDAQTGAPASADVAAEVRQRLSPSLTMADIVGEPPQYGMGGVNPSFAEDTSGQLPPMPSDIGPMSGPAVPARDASAFDMQQYQEDLAGITRGIGAPILGAIDDAAPALPGETVSGDPSFNDMMPYGNVGNEPVPLMDPDETEGGGFFDRFGLSNVGPNLETVTRPFTGRPAPAAPAEPPVTEAPVVEEPAVEEAPTAEEAPLVAGPILTEEEVNNPATYDTDFEEVMTRLGGGSDEVDNDSRQKAMANLAMIGLAIASGQSPNALTNIAQGALAGMKAIRSEDAAKDATRAETRALAAKLATDREIARIRLPGGQTSTYTPERLYQQNLGLVLANPDFYDVFGADGATVDPVKARAVAESLTQRGGASPISGRIVEQDGVQYQEQPDGTFEPLGS